MSSKWICHNEKLTMIFIGHNIWEHHVLQYRSDLPQVKQRYIWVVSELMNNLRLSVLGNGEIARLQQKIPQNLLNNRY